MDSKLLQSQINLVNARITQVKTLDYLTEDQKQKRLNIYEAQLQSLSKQLKVT